MKLKYCPLIIGHVHEVDNRKEIVHTISMSPYLEQSYTKIGRISELCNDRRNLHPEFRLLPQNPVLFHTTARQKLCKVFANHIKIEKARGLSNEDNCLIATYERMVCCECGYITRTATTTETIRRDALLQKILYRTLNIAVIDFRCSV